MRITTVLFLWIVSCAMHGQPGHWMEQLHNPCGFAPNDSIDLTNDGLFDLVVQGISTGTDDEPSSSGHCARYVINLPGTSLWHAREAQGTWRLKVFASGDTIPAEDPRPQDDLRIPRAMYADGAVQAVQWGYGHQVARMSVIPGLASQRFVFRTTVNGKTWHGSFAIEADTLGQVNVRVGALVMVDHSFVVR